MNGRFIAEKVHGNSYVNWNGACQGPGNIPPSIRTSDIVTVVSAPGLEAEVYPNPNSGVFNIKISTISEEPIQAAIYDLSGKKIAILAGIEANVPFSVSQEMAAGVYFINIEVAGQRASVKMIKED